MPTPFQRDISDAHVRRLTQAMDKTKRFLDPIIAVREQTGDAAYWTPNGYHRLTALKELGAKTVLALLVPERAVAYQILALNIEKAHNLREKAIGVRRMYVDLAPISDERRGALRAGVRGAGAGHARLRVRGARAAVGRRLPPDPAQGRPLADRASSPTREPKRRARAALLLEYDEAVTAAVAALKARGFNSPYLRNFVVARTNPLRFIKGEPPPFDELLPSMTKRARGHGRRQDQERGRRAHGRRARGRRRMTGRQR